MMWTKRLLLLLVLFGFIFTLNYTSYKIDTMLGIENQGLVKVGHGADGKLVISLIGTSFPLAVEAEKLTGANSRLREAVDKSIQIARKAISRGNETALVVREAVQKTLEEAENLARGYWAGSR